MTELDIRIAGTARVHVLYEGYVGLLLHIATVIIPGHGAPFGIGARA